MSGGFTPSLRVISDGVNAEVAFLASEDLMVKRGGITIDSSLTAADGDGNKIITAGTLLGEITASGKYTTYDDTGTDGEEVAQGFLLESVNLKDGDVITGLVLRCSVIEARCTGVDAAAKVDLGDRVIWQ
jgi:hypothetical protein